MAISNRVRETDASFALWGLLLGIAGALGSVVHGGYDLSNVLNPVSLVSQAAAAGVPNAIDPRGVLTFGAGGSGSAHHPLPWPLDRLHPNPPADSHGTFGTIVVVGTLVWVGTALFSLLFLL